MAKSLIATLTTYQHSVVTTIRSKWLPVIFVFPVVIYLAFLSYEAELTKFIIPFFPDEPDKSFGFYNDFLRLCFKELLWYSFFAFSAWVLLVYVPLSGVLVWVERPVLARKWTFAVVTSLCCALAAVLVSRFTLQTFANSADEYVYLYQAETLSEGRLTQNAHPLEDFFHSSHIAQKDGMSVGRFPPGWPLLLSIPYFLNIPPYWLNPILAAIALLVFFSFATRYYGARVAVWSLVSLGLSGYYIFNGASYFSHTSCLLFAVAFVYCIHLSRDMRSDAYAFLAGIFLGLIVITRYYTAVLFFVPIVVSLACHSRLRALRPLFFIGLGCLPFVLFLFWYNFSITGSPLLPVTVWADSTEAIGFVKGHSFTRAVEYTIRRILLFLYWCSPAILILYFIFLVQKALDKTRRFIFVEDYFLLMLLAGYFFYHHLGGNQYGPRFLFEALPFAVVFVVDRVIKSSNRLTLALFTAGMIYAMVKLPYIMQREKQVVDERLDLYSKVEEAGLSNAVVLISTHTGVIRPMPPRDLTRNGMTYAKNVIYAEDRGTDNQRLMDFYPERRFYRYVRDREVVGGWLVEVRR